MDPFAPLDLSADCFGPLENRKTVRSNGNYRGMRLDDQTNRDARRAKEIKGAKYLIN